MYLAFINGHWLNDGELNDILAQKEGKGREQVMILVDRLANRQGFRLNDLPEDLQNIYSNREAEKVWSYLKRNNLTKYLDRDDEARYYWENDEQWLKIKNALLNNKIHVLRANLDNPSTIEKVAKAMTTINASISVIDISNAHDAVFNLDEFIAILPKSDDSRLWLTSGRAFYNNKAEKYFIEEEKPGGWRYYSFPTDDPELIRRWQETD